MLTWGKKVFFSGIFFLRYLEYLGYVMAKEGEVFKIQSVKMW